MKAYVQPYLIKMFGYSKFHMISCDLNLHKHNIWTPHVLYLLSYNILGSSILPSSGRKHKYVNGKIC
jgi:hypothetical protein